MDDYRKRAKANRRRIVMPPPGSVAPVLTREQADAVRRIIECHSYSKERGQVHSDSTHPDYDLGNEALAALERALAEEGKP